MKINSPKVENRAFVNQQQLATDSNEESMKKMLRNCEDKNTLVFYSNNSLKLYIAATKKPIFIKSSHFCSVS